MLPHAPKRSRRAAGCRTHAVPRADMNRLKCGYAVRSIDAIGHPDQLPLRHAHAPERYRPHQTGQTPPPSQPRAIPEPAGTSFLIYPWRVLCLPWLHPQMGRLPLGVLTVTQFAHDGHQPPRGGDVPSHARLAVLIIRDMAPTARVVLRRLDTTAETGCRAASAPRRSRLRCGSACPRTDPSVRTSTAVANPRTCAPGCRRGLRKSSTVPLPELDAVICR